MPIDPNIAMGVRPIEQPNMLAQMGQMMQLRQAQQEYEGSNALRDFYAQGGDINKAEDRQRLLSRAPMQGQKIFLFQIRSKPNKLPPSCVFMRLQALLKAPPKHVSGLRLK